MDVVVHPATMKSTRSRYVRSVSPSIRQPPSPDGLTVALQRGGDVVHDHRVLLALVLGVGEHERQQLLGRRTPRSSRRTGTTPSWRFCDVGGGVRVVAAGRREDRDVGERRPASSPRSRYFCDCSGESLMFSWSRKRRSSPFTLKISAFVLRRVGAEHARVEQPVEQEGGVGGLRGDAGDAGDVDVRAARAVEELEVARTSPDRRGRARSAGAASSGRRRARRRARRPSRAAPRSRAAAARRPRARRAWSCTSRGLDRLGRAARRRRSGRRRSRSGRPRGGRAPG